MPIPATGDSWVDGWTTGQCWINRNVVDVAEGRSMVAGRFTVEDGVRWKWETSHFMELRRRRERRA